MKTTLLVLLILIVSSGGAGASDTLWLSTDPTEIFPLIVDDTEGLKTLYVLAVTATSGATSVSFSAPLPGCFADAVYIADSSVFPVTIGDSQSGATVQFGACLAGSFQTPIHVLSILVYSTGLPGGCCWYPVLPHPVSTSGQVEFEDCIGNTVTGWGGETLLGEGGPPLVSNRLPLSGAVDVALDADLSWATQECSDPRGLGVVWADVYFGTSSTPPLVWPMFDHQVFDPGPLEPSTTYYWKLHVVDSDAPPGNSVTETPVWSFTTHGPVPVEMTTWSRIKAMYR